MTYDEAKAALEALPRPDRTGYAPERKIGAWSVHRIGHDRFTCTRLFKGRSASIGGSRIDLDEAARLLAALP